MWLITMSDNQEEGELARPEQLSPKEGPGCPRVTVDAFLV